MDSKPTKWSSLAEFLQSERLSEYIPTFSTLDLKAFSELTLANIDSQVSPQYDRQRIIDAVNFAKACLESGNDSHLRKVTPTNQSSEMNDSMKTPTKFPINQVPSSTPTKTYLSPPHLMKVALRPTKSLSPPMKLRYATSPTKRLSSYEKKISICDHSDGSDSEDRETTENEDGEEGEGGSNLLRMKPLGSSDPSLSTADKSGENTEFQSYHRSRSGRRQTEFRLSSGEFSPNSSPCPSPRAQSPNRPPVLPNFNYLAHRRWSVASSASDYYSGSPSSLSSASSQERLYIPRTSDEDVSHVQLQRQLSQDAKRGPRLRARSLSPERQPEVNVQAETSFNIYKDRFPQAKDEMEKKMQHFIEMSHERSEGSVKGEANANFIHHRVSEIAKDILERSQEERITDTYFEEVSTTLVRLIKDSERSAATAQAQPVGHTGELVVKEASELLKIISRSARLLECLTFSVGSFYSQVQEGTIDELLRSTASLPRYISSRLSTRFGVIDSEEIGSPSSTPSLTPSNGPPSSGTEDEGSDNQFKEEDFEERKLISNGAYGEVLLVKHVDSKELFALKRIRKDRIIERNEVQRAFMERDILAFMQNPFVVSMLCSFQTKTHLCMVLEYVEGGDVGTLLKENGFLDTELARMYHAETLLALEYIHSYGIVHRDLKPENLLITKDGHIKLTDFGLSKCGLMQMATRSYEHIMAAFEDKNGCIGTPDYIAPEVFYSRQYGFSVDWWSMGIILYQFLVGVTPFSGETIQNLVENINPHNIEWPENEPVDRNAKDLILGLLYMDPSHRLGAQGSQEVKQHTFYEEVHWDELLMHKAEFIPYLDSDEDTSYFDTRTDRYDHSISEDCLPVIEGSSQHIKYFDSVNWSSADQFIALSSPRHRQLSYDSVDSGTDNQPSISTDEGSSGEQQPSFQTSSPRDRCFSDGVIRRPIKEEALTPIRQAKTPDPPALHVKSSSLGVLPIPRCSSTPSKSAVAGRKNPLKPGSTGDKAAGGKVAAGEKVVASRKGGDCSELYKNLCTPVKVNNKSPVAPQIKPEQPDFDMSSGEMSGDNDMSVESANDVPAEGMELEHGAKEQSSNSDEIAEIGPDDSITCLPPHKSPVKKLDLSALKKERVDEAVDDQEEEEEEEEDSHYGERNVSLAKGAKGFGFTLIAIKVNTGPLPNGRYRVVVRHMITDVAKFGAASDAGIKKDDLINCVNGERTAQLTHQQVVDLIRGSDKQVHLNVQHISDTSIQMRRGSRTGGGKKKKRQSSFFKKAVNARGVQDSLSMEKFLHLTRKQREKQNSDSDKSGGEQDTLIVHGHQVFSDPVSDAPDMTTKPAKSLRSKFGRRRPSNNFVAPVSPLARTPSPTGHNCYFNADADRKTPRTTAQKTLHITHPRTQSLSSGTKKESVGGAVTSPLSTRKSMSPCLKRRDTHNYSPPPRRADINSLRGDINPLRGDINPLSSRGDPQPCKEETHQPPTKGEFRPVKLLTPPIDTQTASGSADPLSAPAIKGERLTPANRQRKKSWAEAFKDRDTL